MLSLPPTKSPERQRWRNSRGKIRNVLFASCRTGGTWQVKAFKGTTLVSIREFYMKDGKLLPGSKGISLSSEQWSTFKTSVPSIEEAITKMEGRIRSELNGKQNGDAPNSVVDVAPLEPVPVEVIRFDGKNYHFWAQQMELLLKQLKIEYVLTEPCPNATLGEGVSTEELAAAKAAERRWLNDDLMCRRNILSHLSDPLFNQNANRKMSAKELWEELKLVYLYEEFGTKRSQVKKYIEFQMVDEKAVVEQTRELNGIADSIAAAGMFIDDNFHVSVIISKLPPSWKDFCIKLMREEYLPFWKLMERIQIEEESRNGVKRVGEHSNSIGFHLANRGGQKRVDNRPLGMCRNRSEINAKSVPCSICGKKGHLSKNCWRRYDKQANERTAEEDVRIPTEVDTLGATQ
ncbi:RNA polymerase II transcriptional coactivator KELP [Spatholobus suberectus]|nr:RNA polymerase II transcriptional coactivator KELP [Spatholobus suberectus]